MCTTVATYFNIIPLKNNFSQCKICMKEIKNSVNRRNQRAHIKRCHPYEFTLIQKTQPKNANNQANLGISTISTLTNSRKRKLPEPLNGGNELASLNKLLMNGAVGQTVVTLPVYTALPSPSKLVAPRIQSRAPSESELYQQKLLDVMLHFLIKHNVPLKLIECEKYKTLMKEYLPLFKLTDKRELVTRMENKFLVLSFILKSRFKEVDWFVFTTEVWFNHTYALEYWGVTAHYVWNYEIQSVTIGVFDIHGDDITELMEDDFICLAKEWCINKEKIIAIIVDTNGRQDIVKAVDLFVGEKRRLPCFASTINSIPAKAIKSTPNLVELLNKLKNVVKFFKDDCEAAYNEVKSMDPDGNKLKLTDDVCLTWNNTYYMIEKFGLLGKHVESVLLKYPNAPKMMAENEMAVLKEVAFVLNPFIQVIEEISQESYGEGGKLVPMIYCFKSCLLEVRTKLNTQIAKDLHTNLVQEANFKLQYFEQSKISTIAALLDPRFKNICISNQTMCDTATGVIVEEVFAAEEKSTSSDETPMKYDDPNVKFNSFWAYHDKRVAEVNRRIKENEIAANMPRDVEHHLESRCVPRSVKTIDHWKSMQNCYPRISKVALKYLTLCASTVPAERLFTKTGRASTEARNELKGSKLPKLMFLQSLKESEWRL